MCVLRFIPARDASAWAERVAAHIAKMAAGSGGRYLAEDIFAAIYAGQFQLWTIARGDELLAVVVTAVETYPRARELRVIGLSGRQWRVWGGLIADLERAAREHFGCTKIAAMHIPKLHHILPGYQTTHWLSEKDLTCAA